MRATYQSSSSYQSSSQGQQGSAARGATTTFGAADSKAEREAFLKYAYGDSDALVISGSSVLVAFAVAAGVGVFFGFYPARKASALDPIEALRYQ